MSSQKTYQTNVQEFGKALEEESSRLRDHTSESIPGEKNMRRQPRAVELPAKGPGSSDD